jgi:diguanylate cyclase (GGDEF)-like protein
MEASTRHRALFARLHWDLSDETMPSRDRATIARTYIYLYALGATLVLVSLAFPGAPARWEPGMLAVVAVAYVFAAALLVAFDRLPFSFFAAMSPVGTVLITAIVASAGAGAVTLYAVLYFWAVLSTASFFSTRATVLNLAWVGVCYGLALALVPNVTQGVQRWLMVIVTLGVISIVTLLLRGRGERLLDVLRLRSVKQEKVAELGQIALTEEDVPKLCSLVSDAVVEALEVEQAAVFSAPDGEDELLLKAGSGFEGVMKLPRLRRQDPLAVSALDSFGAIQRKGRLAIAIRGAEGPIGMLIAYGSDDREFEPSETAFLQSVAHVIGEATERQRVAAEREHLALHDHLTGRPNRKLFTDRLTDALGRAGNGGPQLAVLFLDLDDFKLINDSFGHGAGDALLKAVGPRLRDALVMTDTVARFGGDEFAVLCEDVDSEAHAVEIATRLRAALQEPFQIGGADYRISASIGVVLSAGETGPEELIADADAAMYRAKEKTRGGFEFFDSSLRKKVRMRLEYENALRAAPESDQLSLTVQPIVGLPDGEPVGAEALLRWQHPDLGEVPPAEFIPIAEQTGAILPLGEWVLREALRLAALWRADERRRYLPLHVNLSARQLAQPNFVGMVQREFERTGARRRDVGFEITEHALISENTATVQALEQLQATGSPIVLDDFGTGYSSLSHLKRFPIDVVKVDRAFVSNLERERKDEAIVAAVVGMADAFALDVVAEGVETAEQARLLAQLGCRFGQGFYFSKPIPAAEMEVALTPRGAWPGTGEPSPDQSASANPVAFRASSREE